MNARMICFVASAVCLVACKSESPSDPDAGSGSGGASPASGGTTGSGGSTGGSGNSGTATGGSAGSRDAGVPSTGGRTSETDASSDGSPDAATPDAGRPPKCDSPDKTDTDHDGIPDACDDDDDNDGFVDGDDPAPKDATLPGLFFTPEQILANTHVKTALAAASSAGYEVKTHTEHGAPALSGYYVKPEGEGKMVASGNGDNVDDGITGEEIRFTVSPGDYIASANIGYLNGALFGTGITATGALLRGKDDEFTIYDRHVVRCLEPGSDSAVYAIRITNAHLSSDPAFEGYWLEIRVLTISIATTGTLTDACAAEYAGDLETVGGWAESGVPRYIPTAVSDLKYMCVENGTGYVPGESLVHADGTRCLCDDTSTLVCGLDGG